MAAAIFELATSINIDQRQTTYRAVSQSGTARTAIGSPLFYYFEVRVRPFYREDLERVQREIAATRYGVDTFTSAIPHGLVWADSNWSPTTTVRTAANAGAVVTLNSTANTNFQALDWIQFSNHNKVYQLRESADSNSVGAVGITLNTGLVSAVTTNPSVSVRTGADVEFNLLFQQIPNLTSVPGQNGLPLYEFDGPFLIREVL